MSRVSDLVSEHVKRGPICYKHVHVNEVTKKEEIIYMIKSVSRPNQVYNIIYEGGQWYCDCPSFKYKSGTNTQGHCKHIQFVVFMIQKNVEIPET